MLARVGGNSYFCTAIEWYRLQVSIALRPVALSARDFLRNKMSGRSEALRLHFFDSIYIIVYLHIFL